MTETVPAPGALLDERIGGLVAPGEPAACYSTEDSDACRLLKLMERCPLHESLMLVNCDGQWRCRWQVKAGATLARYSFGSSSFAYAIAGCVYRAAGLLLRSKGGTDYPVSLPPPEASGCGFQVNV